MKRVVPAFFLIASVAAMAKPPQRFLGPPVKKPVEPAGPPEPADGGVASDAQVAAEPGDARAEETPGRPALKAGDQAPRFSGVLHDPDQAGMQRIDLGSLVGSGAGTEAKTVLISFFATGCKPCKKELPLLQQLSTEYKDRGLRIVIVAIDRDEAQWRALKQLVAQNRLTFPIVNDRDHTIARQYLGRRTQLPSVFIVAKDGTIALVKQGYPGDAARFLRSEVERALR